MHIVFLFVIFLGLTYLLLRLFPVRPVVSPDAAQPIVPSLRRSGPMETLKEWGSSLVRAVTPSPLPKSKGYVPNRYGYGGMDPSGGLRRGGDGHGIPDEVDVGWWNGEVSYPERQLSPVVDSETIPSPQVHEVGWWGDDW